jgi:hypothetical protein
MYNLHYVPTTLGVTLMRRSTNKFRDRAFGKPRHSAIILKDVADLYLLSSRIIGDWQIGKDAEVDRGICLEGLRETTKNFSQDSLSPGFEHGTSRIQIKSNRSTTAFCDSRLTGNYHLKRAWKSEIMAHKSYGLVKQKKNIILEYRLRYPKWHSNSLSSESKAQHPDDKWKC